MSYTHGDLIADMEMAADLLDKIADAYNVAPNFRSSDLRYEVEYLRRHADPQEEVPLP